MTRSTTKAISLNNTNYIDKDYVDDIVLNITDIFNEKISMIKSDNDINKLNIIINNQNDIIKSLSQNVNDLNSYASITSKNIDKISTSVDKTIVESISKSSISIHKKYGVKYAAILYNIDESKDTDCSCRKIYDSKEWLSRDICEAIRLRNRLRRNIKNNRKEWITACREVQIMIRVSKEERWKDFISNSSLSNDPNKIWATIKALSGKSASSIRNETLIHNGKCYTSSRAKANAFMHRYAEISRLDIPKSSRHKIRRTLNAPSVAEESCQAFNLAELSVAIKSMKPKGAPGKYRIAPRFINALGPVALSFMLAIFNDSWFSGKCPPSWREAVIIPLLKKGKPAIQIDSFRPISLTSCVAKTMERMVANRLSNLAERSGWWCEDQAGLGSS